MPRDRILSICIVAAALVGCVEGYSSEAILYHAAAQQGLVAECARNIRSCNSNKRLFREGGDGVYTSLYETRDAAEVSAVAAKLLEMRYKVPVPLVKLTAYSSRRGQSKEKYGEVTIE